MSEVYQIAMRISLVNDVSAALGTIAAQMLNLQGLQGKVNAGFAQMNKAVAGMAGVLGGTAIIAGLSKIADKGKDILDQQNQLVRLGISQNDVLRVTNDFWTKVAKNVPTATVAEYLQTVKELRAVTGSLETAQDFAPRAMMFDALLSNVMGKKVEGQLYRLLRAGELKGIATDPEKLESLVQQSYSYVAAFGGKLTPSMIQNLAVRGGTAWMNADLKTAFGPMAVLAAEMGAAGGGGGSSSSPGVVLYQLQQLMTGAHTMSKQQFEVMNKLGLIDPSKVTHTGFHGGTLQLQPGAVRGSLEYAGNVPGWAKDVVWPALAKLAQGNDALLQNYLAKIAPTTNMAKAIELFGNPEFLKQQAKDLGLAAEAFKLLPSYRSFVGQNPLGVEEAFGAQKQAMMASIGAPLMQLKIPTLRALTEMFTTIGALANAHPEAIKTIAEGLAVLAGSMMAGGMVALAAAIGPAGWLVVGLAALAGSFAVFGKKMSAEDMQKAFGGGGGGPNYAGMVDTMLEKMKGWGAALNTYLGPLNTWFAGFNQRFTAAIAALPGEVDGAIKAAFAAIANAIKSALSGIWNGIGGLFHHSSLEGGGGAPGSGAGGHASATALHSAAWAPGRSDRTVVVHTAIDIDGRRLAGHVSPQLASLYEFPTQAPFHDGRSGWSPPDMQTVTT